MRQALTFWLRHRSQAAWLISVLTIAAGVSTAVWSISYGLWFERPPLRDPERLVSVGWRAARTS